MSVRLGGKEYKIDVDTGCNLYPKCLECPLPVCRYDVHEGRLTIRGRERATEIIRLHREKHLSVKRIAHRCNCSKRTVYRQIRRWREQIGRPYLRDVK